MDFDDFLTYIKSWSAYQTAKGKGVELLGEGVVQRFKLAWGEDDKKIAKFPVYLRIGRVRNASKYVVVDRLLIRGGTSNTFYPIIKYFSFMVLMFKIDVVVEKYLKL